MVTKGQLLERPVVIPRQDGICLDGIYLRGDAPGLLIASPIPGEGGSMASPIPCELAYAAAFAGAASLRMDYQGVGASEGESTTDLKSLVDDLAEGLSFLCESSGDDQAVVAGLYSGAWPVLALAKRDPRVGLVILLCPRDEEAPEGAPHYGDVSRPVRVIQAENDPSFNRGAEMERIEATPNTRLHVVAGSSRHFREGLRGLASLIPPLLGRDRGDR